MASTRGTYPGRSASASLGVNVVPEGLGLLESIEKAEIELERRFADRLHVNADLDRSLVSFQANKGEIGHRWCKYKEGFSAGLMRYLFRKLDLSSGRIMDPFAGSGTALFAASECGMDALGIELLPSSAEIILVRELVDRSDKKNLARVVRRFAESRVWEKKGQSEVFPHIRITAGAFPNETEAQLGRFLHEAGEVRDPAAQRLLRFAAMCVLESVSFTRKDGQYLRWDSRSGRRAGGKLFDKGYIPSFSEAIIAKLREIADDLDGSNWLFSTAPTDVHSGRVELRVGSCLELLPRFDAASFDGLVTSPPYCNRYDYTRTYALELALLGVGEEGIRRLRQEMLCCTVENREKNGLENLFGSSLYRTATTAFESHPNLHKIIEYLDHRKQAGAINNPGIPRMVKNYFREMCLVVFAGARLLKPNAPFVMVNDNVRYEGAHVPVDLILSDFAEAAGLSVESIWVLPRGKGNSSQQMGAHGREELRKCVYIWRSKARQAKMPDRQAVSAP